MKAYASLLLAAIVSASAQECTVDITKTAANLTSAGFEIAAAVADCAQSKAAQCSADISGAAASLTSAATHIEQAVGDCGGDDPYCAEAITGIVSDIAATSK